MRVLCIHCHAPFLLLLNLSMVHLPLPKQQAAASQPMLDALIRSFMHLVGAAGFEPTRPYGHGHLKPARLPFRHAPKRLLRCAKHDMQQQ